MTEPLMTKTSDGWLARGHGWAVHGTTEDEARRLFRKRERLYEEIEARPEPGDGDSTHEQLTYAIMRIQAYVTAAYGMRSDGKPICPSCKAPFGQGEERCGSCRMVRAIVRTAGATRIEQVSVEDWEL